MQYSTNIQPLHDVRCNDKLSRIIESMQESGWIGHPLVVRADEDGNLVGINGSHRVRAAHRVGLEVPCVCVSDDEYTARAEQFGGIDELCDEDRLAILEAMGEQEAAEIMRAEIASND